MKVRIDTQAKTVAIEEPVGLDELVKFVKALFPDNWKEWKVETNVKFEITSRSILWPDYHPWPYYYSGTPRYATGGTSSIIGDGTTTVGATHAENTFATNNASPQNVGFTETVFLIEANLN